MSLYFSQGIYSGSLEKIVWFHSHSTNERLPFIPLRKIGREKASVKPQTRATLPKDTLVGFVYIPRQPVLW